MEKTSNPRHPGQTGTSAHVQLQAVFHLRPFLHPGLQKILGAISDKRFEIGTKERCFVVCLQFHIQRRPGINQGIFPAGFWPVRLRVQTCHDTQSQQNVGGGFWRLSLSVKGLCWGVCNVWGRAVCALVPFVCAVWVKHLCISPFPVSRHDPRVWCVPDIPGGRHLVCVCVSCVCVCVCVRGYVHACMFIIKCVCVHAPSTPTLVRQTI